MKNKTNARQRKFLNELANLMQKYNTSLVVIRDLSGIQSFSFDQGSGKSFEFTGSLTPSGLRKIAEKK